MTVYGARHGGAGRTFGTALLAHAAKVQWGLDDWPTTLRGTYGKPFFPDTANRHFNLSHSGGVVVCALDDQPVGIDVQIFRAPSRLLLREVCTSEELSWLEGWGTGGFALLWAMKESRCKWSGRGLTRPVRDISVPLPQMPLRAGDWTILSREGLTFSVWGDGTLWVSVCGRQAPQAPIHWMRQEESE